MAKNDIQNKLRNAMRASTSESTERAMNAIINNDTHYIIPLSS